MYQHTMLTMLDLEKPATSEVSAGAQDIVMNVSIGIGIGFGNAVDRATGFSIDRLFRLGSACAVLCKCALKRLDCWKGSIHII